MWLFFSFFHEPTSCTSSPATLKSPVIKSKFKKRKKKQCGDNVDLTIKNVILFETTH